MDIDDKQDKMITIQVAIGCLLEASGRTLVTILDQIYDEVPPVEGLEGFDSPKEQVIYGEKTGRYNPNATHVSKELFNALLEKSLIALKDNVKNPASDAPIIREPVAIAWHHKLGGNAIEQELAATR